MYKYLKCINFRYLIYTIFIMLYIKNETIRLKKKIYQKQKTLLELMNKYNIDNYNDKLVAKNVMEIKILEEILDYRVYQYRENVS